ncbi:short-chain dehydrogenase [Artomyces pyxidatus]|uniref:Short-chain dehydrogenase n=1 Tax=Artomyces pyxidatus TaxID=48021 RepID=A0ACB8TBN8_9AGAM|nr:short-chain dehydrogenase [Artomyces pyxidatus]
MGRRSFLGFLATQYDPLPPVEPQDLSGKTVLVVGANIGLGYEAAKHFANMKPGKLILACRTVEKGKQAAHSTILFFPFEIFANVAPVILTAIKEETSFENIEARAVDLSVSQSVVDFADLFVKEEDRLDVYVYNAGVALDTHTRTVDDWETTLQVNDLSSMLLTVLLLPLMLKSPDPKFSPRAVIVASDVHFAAVITPEELASPNLLETFNDKEHCTPHGDIQRRVMSGRYNLSKLLNVFFVRELASRLPANSPLIVNAVNPGLCHSGLSRNARFPTSLFMFIFKALVARTTEMGSRPLVWAATAARHREHDLRGAYVSDSGVKEPSDFVLSEEGARVQKRLWNETADALTKVSPKFKAIVDEYLSG